MPETISNIDRFILKHAIRALVAAESPGTNKDFDADVKSFGHGFTGVAVTHKPSGYELDLTAIEGYPGVTWRDDYNDERLMDGFFESTEFTDNEEGREAFAHHITKWVKLFVENPTRPRFGDRRDGDEYEEAVTLDPRHGIFVTAYGGAIYKLETYDGVADTLVTYELRYANDSNFYGPFVSEVLADEVEDAIIAAIKAIRSNPI